MNPNSPPRAEYLHSDSSIPTTATLLSTSEETAAAADIARSKSTKRLLATPDHQTLSVNTTPFPDDDQLHAIVGQHLAFTPTIPEVPTLPSPPSASSDGVFRNELPSTGDALSVPGGAIGLGVNTTGLPFVTPDSSTIHSAASVHPSDSNLLQAETASAGFDTPSHFNMQGADVSNDVYKWHEKETRAKLNRAQTYHAPINVDEGADIANIRAPGGFRRHYIQQDAATRGHAAPHLPTKSFIHFLGKFNMYDMDHFAGENFHSVPKRSIVVPKDAEKRRQSLMITDTSQRRIFMGEELAEDEEVIEEPDEKIGFSKALGMLFKS